jgi:hypothetical protein
MALPRPKHHAMLAQSDRLRVAVDRDMPHGQKAHPRSYPSARKTNQPKPTGVATIPAMTTGLALALQGSSTINQDEKRSNPGRSGQDRRSGIDTRTAEEWKSTGEPDLRVRSTTSAISIGVTSG